MEPEGQEENEVIGLLSSRISEMMMGIQAARSASVDERVRRNAIGLNVKTLNFLELATTRENLLFMQESGSKNMIFVRMESPICTINVLSQGLGNKDGNTGSEVLSMGTVKLPRVERIPPYTTWIFLEKNKKMLDEDSVIGKRHIYYDPGGETLICSDSENEIVELDTERYMFSEGEDQLIWRILQEHGVIEEVLDSLSRFIQAPPSEIQERYNILVEVYEEKRAKVDEYSEKDMFLEKSLKTVLDSFDKLFCRRCLVFDCRMHECFQDLIIPSEKQPYWCDTEENRKPCSDHCYLWTKKGIKQKIIDPTALCQKDATSEKSDNFYRNIITEETVYSTNGSATKQSHTSKESVSCSTWRPIEKELYLKGVEMFGRNSCLIARNLLNGFKTCTEVNAYKFRAGGVKPLRPDASSNTSSEDNESVSNDNLQEQEMPNTSQLFRKRGRARKLKSSWKSAGHPSFRKRIADEKQEMRKLYTPCGCKDLCGKQCPCYENGTCCEKYCGCSKSCKMRFRGCHCAKSQCRSRQCPCFAADRECDPDVCKNCWVSCGDGSLIEPSALGDGYQCGNMQLFLKQQQRIILAKSDVSGWGAFLKNSVNKNDFLGEYTGELISHREADKRGKIYDRVNSSYLFDLNDKFVLDAQRKGDKLKFANHSSKPNCCAKVMLVAGDHRVGIFAKEHIDAGEELFYDYCYSPDHKITWAQKPEDSRKHDMSASHRRAKKQSV